MVPIKLNTYSHRTNALFTGTESSCQITALVFTNHKLQFLFSLLIPCSQFTIDYSQVCVVFAYSCRSYSNNVKLYIPYYAAVIIHVIIYCLHSITIGINFKGYCFVEFVVTFPHKFFYYVLHIYAASHILVHGIVRIHCICSQ